MSISAVKRYERSELNKNWEDIGKEWKYTMNNKKIPLGSLISTILIGIYMIFLLCAGIGSIFLGRYAGKITAAGINLATDFGRNGDYISGYFMFPGSLTALLGGMTGVVAFLLVAGSILLLLIFLILLIFSIGMLKKQKIKVDACVKIIVFFILTIFSWLLFQSVWISLLLVIPVVLGMIVLLNVKETIE